MHFLLYLLWIHWQQSPELRQTVNEYHISNDCLKKEKITSSSDKSKSCEAVLLSCSQLSLASLFLTVSNLASPTRDLLRDGYPCYQFECISIDYIVFVLILCLSTNLVLRLISFNKSLAFDPLIDSLWEQLVLKMLILRAILCSQAK